jgi:hypothetical protein
MALRPETIAFLRYLQANALLRAKIRAETDCTLLYCGYIPWTGALGNVVEKGMWKDIKDFKKKHPEYNHLETLTEVLGRVAASGTGHPSLLKHVEHIVGAPGFPERPDALILWKALSGIFASNAIGKVSFAIGAGVIPTEKVFASTEVAVLLRNPLVDPISKDMLEYYLRCIESGQTSINVSFIAS